MGRLYPEHMDRIVPASGTAKTYGHGIVRLESEIIALTTDEAFQGGDYKEEPVKGIQTFSLVWTTWLFSQSGGVRSYGDPRSPPEPNGILYVIAYYDSSWETEDPALNAPAIIAETPQIFATAKPVTNWASYQRTFPVTRKPWRVTGTDN